MPPAAGLILGAGGAWFMLLWGDRLGFTDLPNERSSHVKPTPKSGGVGIFIAFLACALVLPLPAWFWVPVAGVALLSLYDDYSGLTYRFRLFGQFAAALVLLLSNYEWFGPTVVRSLLILPAAVYIVGTANFYNFMDGIDGMAGITGFIAFGLLALMGQVAGAVPNHAMLAMALSAACLGFLPFNLYKARRVFMGDVGSILLGFTFAFFTLSLARSLTDFICLAAFLFPFYGDELTTMAIRLKDGERLTQPHRRHLYQILANEIGLDHWKVSLGYGILQIACGLSVMAVRSDGWLAAFLTLLLFSAGFIAATLYVRLVVRRRFHREANL